MKNLALSIIALTALHVQAEVPKENADFLKCLRKSALSHRMDLESMKKTISLIENYKIEKPQTSITQCQKNLFAIRKLSKKSQRDLVSMLYSIPHLEKTYHILHPMLAPEMNCKLYGVDAQVSVGIGAGAGISIGNCVTDHGRKWGVLAPTLILTAGIGGTISYAKRDFNDLTVGDPLAATDFTSENTLFVGTGDGAHTETYSTGLSWMGGVEITVPLKLIPLGNDFEELNKKLME